jgi:hypothetical protein
VDPFASQLVASVALTTGLGAMMVWLGSRMNALELRTQRRCPSCGVRAERRSRCRCYS